ncbi:MAG TPA: metallophosphoesterase [Methanothrix sp.]|nr:metallophosphoesterase [Methanothrix sp.]HOV82748.1 metallophosphoesterase [Methanothrix sp.]HPC89325.1 metallophosphoesterase [Methanothrix sp.]HQE88128.1 metallophosphoesterase [Methanothrix sp.]HQI68951.1 metallophosphoesterase [Methanothrix sp.]
MLIGIMSDAHDSIQGVKDAILALSKRGVEMALFAGDMIGSGNCYTFEGFGVPMKLVYGNNDGDRVGLAREFARVGGEYLGDFGEFEADGLNMAMLHGTEEALVKAVVASQLYDVVVRGHNHRPEATRHGRTLLVNPGEIWGYLTGRSSVAVLDTKSLDVEFIELGRFKTFREIINE